MDLHPLSAGSAYASARPATKPDLAFQAETKLQPGDFSSLTKSLQETEAVALKSMSGTADPHALVMAIAQTELAVETAVTVRNKVVEAYQEILRMPV